MYVEKLEMFSKIMSVRQGIIGILSFFSSLRIVSHPHLLPAYTQSMLLCSRGDLRHYSVADRASRDTARAHPEEGQSTLGGNGWSQGHVYVRNEKMATYHVRNDVGNK